MRRFVVLAILVAACEPQPQPAAVAAPPDLHAQGDACRDDIPDCAAACALRETRRSDYVDFYERRCAAVILGKNPDKIEPLEPTPYPNASATAAASAEFPPQTRASLSLQPPPAFDPVAVPRISGTEPAECKAARMLRVQRRDREADMMSALCVAKGGGDGGT
ncbi:MAG TPA: hypothetical protein VGH28_09595 [Polyangiaceae bacterium]|jgi:hypothetical protein